MDNPESPVVEHQKLLTSQKLKKKSKNKKSSGKGVANNSSIDPFTEVAKKSETRIKTSGVEMVSENGLLAKLEQHLHITEEGLQFNGTGESFNSRSVQNGHHSPANDTATNTRTQQQTSLIETAAAGTLKKSKSKNKQRNKEANREYEYNTSQLKRYNCNRDSSSPIFSKRTDIKNNTTEIDMVEVKNGFHNCVNERNVEMHSKMFPQQCLSNESNTAYINPDTITKALVNPESVLIFDSASQQNPSATTTAALTNSSNSYDITTIPKQNNTAKPNSEGAFQAKQKVENQPMLRSVATANEVDLANVHIDYKEYESELQMHDIMRLIQAELSEPYSIYTYRYFIYNWPKLCFLAAHGNEYVGAIVCKLDMHMNVRRGYIAMLAVRKEYRKLKIGTTLVQKAIE
ncbi:N-alpha-acetyltransferase 30A isoform X2 [Ceratitis capitata]|nr:N-alpha-acetyltransferase 30A isoform X2 [Ceratitis capitata]